jgi:choline-sulfatase
MTGKWHCRANAEKAFDVAKDIRPGMPKDVELGYNRPSKEGEDPWSPSDPKFGGFWEGGTHWSEVVANHAEDFIEEAKQDDSPFFMYLAFNAPHDPRQAPQAFVDRYPADRVAIPDNFQPLYPFADAIGCGKSLRDERLAPFPRTSRAVQVHRSEYYALITHMDAQIGRILKALAASGKSENTWIFFTADHGLAVGQHGLFGKQNMYDHSVRVPFIVSGPGVEQGKRIAEPIYLQDVMPTSLQLADIAKPQHVEFNSLLPLLDGAKSSYDFIYGCYLEKQRSIRTKTHKLIVYPEAPQVRLYDLQNDPLEMDDIASLETSKPLARELFDELVLLQRQMNDKLDISSARP